MSVSYHPPLSVSRYAKSVCHLIFVHHLSMRHLSVWLLSSVICQCQRSPVMSSVICHVICYLSVSFVICHLCVLSVICHCCLSSVNVICHHHLSVSSVICQCHLSSSSVSVICHLLVSSVICHLSVSFIICHLCLWHSLSLAWLLFVFNVIQRWFNFSLIYKVSLYVIQS